MLITFATMELKDQFLHKSFIQFRNGTSVINDDNRPLMYELPDELPDAAITLRLKKYCSLVSSRRGKHANSEV